MAASSATGEMYEQLIAISEMAFAGRQYEAAYHALIAALYCANDLRDVQRLAAVEQLANEQIQWIDHYDSTHRHSTPSAVQRGNPSIYNALTRQAASMRRMLHVKHEELRR